MTDRTTETSPLVYARVAGVLYLIIFVGGFFSLGYVPSTLIVPGDATATAINITASESLFRIGFVSDSVVFLIDVVMSVLLYVLLKPVSRTLSLVAAFFRLAQTIVNGLNLLNNATVLLLLSGAGYLTAFEPDQLHALALLVLNAHGYGILIGQLFFGLHLLVLGYLVFKSGYFPRILGILLVLASLGYLVESFGNFLFPDYEEIFTLIVVVPAVIGELGLAIWLLVKGVNVELWEERALASA